MNEIHLSSEFEDLLSIINGKTNHHGDTGFKNSRQWGKRLTIILSSIEKSIVQNIATTDETHKNDLLWLCSEAKGKITSSKNIDQINQDTIYYLVKLIFNLLGNMPDHWDLKKVNNRKHWDLNEYRSICYTQDSKQKKDLVLKLANQTNHDLELPEITVLEDKLYKDFKGNEIKFILWFKEYYPEAYLKIF